MIEKSSGINYVLSGRPDKARPSMILVHGAGGTHLDWPAELRRMADQHVVAIDLPGHGRSAGPGRDSVANYARVVSEFSRAIGLSSFIVAGHSMGGAIALWLGLNDKAVSGLILVGTGARLRVAPWILENVMTDFDETVKLISEHAWGPAAPNSYVAAADDQLGKCDPFVLRDDYLACNSFDLMSKVAGIAVPTLVVSGEKDQFTPPKYGRYLADSIPGAEYQEIEKAGHMMALERAESVAGHVARFLGQIPSQQGSIR